MKLAKLVTLLTGLVLSFNSVAAIVTYNAKSSFLGDTGATSATGALPDLGFNTTYSTVTLGSITINQFNSGRFFMNNRFDAADLNLFSGNSIAINDIENLQFVSSTPVYSMGFDFLESTTSGGTQVDSTFTVTLRSNGNAIDQFTFNAPDNTLSFVGVWSDTLFDTMEVVETTGAGDNELYGEVYTGSIAAVPVPAALWLFGSGLIGLLGLAKRGR